MELAPMVVGLLPIFTWACVVKTTTSTSKENNSFFIVFFVFFRCKIYNSKILNLFVLVTVPQTQTKQNLK
jgi:hypothetical protein